METQSGKPGLLSSVFQVAEVTRPLMSVSRICDQGFVCVFDDVEAKAQTNDGKHVCSFAREGGLYVAKLKLKRPDLGQPARFGRQDQP